MVDYIDESEMKLLITILKCISSMDEKAKLLENYIQEKGPIPDKYKEEIREVMVERATSIGGCER